MARFDLKLIKNLKPYYRRRRLSERARDKREARAAELDAERDEAARAASEAGEEAQSPEQETARVAVSETIQRWLEENRLFGT